MNGLKETIAGIGILISGVIGVAIGNLEETLTSSSGSFVQPYTYYLFMLFIVIGWVFIFIGLKKKND